MGNRAFENPFPVLKDWPAGAPSSFGERRRMGSEPVTRASLLVRLRDRHDDTAWAQFVEVYGPLVYRYARRRGSRTPTRPT